jgi:ornithine cyclodeaminase
MGSEPIWITEEEVGSLLTLEEGIDILAAVYRDQGAGVATNMPRAHAREGEAILHAVGGVLKRADVTGIKTWTYTPNGASPVVILFSLSDGRLIGIVEAFAMGQMRTAATTGLGTRVLSLVNARTLALLGTGRQALTQARAVACVRPIEYVQLFGRDPGRRARMAAQLKDTIGVNVSEYGTVKEAMTGADIVITITRAAEPIVSRDMLAAGMHINAVGAVVPSRQELEGSAVAGCDVIVADSAEQARHDSGEIQSAVEIGAVRWDQVLGLPDVVDKVVTQVRKPTDVTLFKALGVGVSDVALGLEVVERARAADVGAKIPTQSWLRANH